MNPNKVVIIEAGECGTYNVSINGKPLHSHKNYLSYGECLHDVLIELGYSIVRKVNNYERVFEAEK